jgi:hypothetical protein
VISTRATNLFTRSEEGMDRRSPLNSTFQAELISRRELAIPIVQLNYFETFRIDQLCPSHTFESEIDETKVETEAKARGGSSLCQGHVTNLAALDLF